MMQSFPFSAVVVNPASYDAVIAELKDAGGKLSLGTRESLAAEAFSYTARYDSAISRWFVEKQDDFPPLLTFFDVIGQSHQVPAKIAAVPIFCLAILPDAAFCLWSFVVILRDSRRFRADGFRSGCKTCVGKTLVIINSQDVVAIGGHQEFEA